MAAEFFASKPANRDNSTLTVRQCIDKYVESRCHILSPETIRGYDVIRRNRLKSIMKRVASTLTTEDIQRAINEDAAHLSPKTIRNTNALITGALKFSKISVGEPATLPPKVKTYITIPTLEDMKRIFNAVSNDADMEICVYLGALCGLRRNEICALTWSDIDFERHTLSISKALVQTENRNLVEKATKTTAGKRIITVFTPAMKILQKHRRPSGHVVTISPNVITGRFSSLLRRNSLPHCRFHDSRHYAVSVMLSLNMPKKYIADYVEHETERMIDTVYGHIMQGRKDEFVSAVDHYFTSFLSKHDTNHDT